jgi:L-methionine (R)-S-oxide reductase
MTETTLDLRHLPKAEAYETLQQQIDAVLEGIDDPIAEMATISTLVFHAFGHLWVGFYRVVQQRALLRVGPYQGTLGCLEIKFGAGVCGDCARNERTLIVPEVEKYPGHITCDARSQSEIVVPVFDATGSLLAVFDLDSERVAAFDDVDADYLSRIVARFASRPDPAARHE